MREISDYTKSPEILGGRVKTLHPKIHGGILADRGNPEHVRTLDEQATDPIDVVVVNLYPFEEKFQSGLSPDELIEYIDIGGIIASAGIASVEDIEAVRGLGCAGAIVGRALYEGQLSLQDALSAAAER